MLCKDHAESGGLKIESVTAKQDVSNRGVLAGCVLQSALGCDEANAAALDVPALKTHAAVVALVVTGGQLVGQCFGHCRGKPASLEKTVAEVEALDLRI